jgi:hypothetical protein
MGGLRRLDTIVVCPFRPLRWFVQASRSAVFLSGVLFLAPSQTMAERWYGNLILSALHSSADQIGADNGSSYMAHAIVNVEDVLFYKNRIRLAGNFDWRRQADGYKTYRPIYYFDLTGYGYALNTSYTRYGEKGLLPIQGTLIDVNTRDWRNVLQITPKELPSLTLMYNRVRTFNNDTIQVNDQLLQTFSAQSSYTGKIYSLKGTHQRARTDDYIYDRTNDVVRTSSGTVSVASPTSRLGSANVTFNYFDNHRTLAGVPINRGNTSSLSAMVSTEPVKRITTGVSYSGQFTQKKWLLEPTAYSRTEVFAANIGYAPTTYLDFRVIKGYQIEGAKRQYNISEYMTFQANLSRYLRQGVDTRISATRTIFQQGDRSIDYLDSLRNLDSSIRIKHYYIDTWYGSVAVTPVPYIKVSQGLSISRDSHPTQANRRIQMSATTDARFWLRENLEGRLSYSNNYQGERLRIGHVSGENYNMGASWTPMSNASITLAYIYAVYNAQTRNTSSSFSLYTSYSFRRVYNLSLSYNRRDQSAVVMLPSTEARRSLPPETINAQLMFFTSSRSTFTLGYLWDRGNPSDSGQRTMSTWRSNLNLQL